MSLELKVTELSTFQNEVVSLRNEITTLKVRTKKNHIINRTIKYQITFFFLNKKQESNGSELQRLAEENDVLRTRLHDVVQSPLSDTEKQQIIDDSHRLHSSAPASIALTMQINENNDGTPCGTPDWDKHSNSSEVSVACLQDKIVQVFYLFIYSILIYLSYKWIKYAVFAFQSILLLIY